MRLSVFFLFLPCISFTQQTIDATQFFARGLSNFKQIEKPTGEAVNFPWVDKYEFRTETRDFDLKEQEYTLRLSPNSGKIRNAQKAYYEEMRNAPDIDGQEIYCDNISALHLDWLSLFFLNENQKALNKLLVVLNDKQATYEKMMGTYEFDPEKFIKLKTEKSDIEIDLNKLNLELDYFFNKHNIQDQEIDFGNFITIENISERLENNILALSEVEIIDEEIAHKKQLLLKEIDLELSEEKRLVDFVQFKYNGPHADPLQERVSVGLGFQLSNSSSKKLKMQELKIEQEELNVKAARNTQEKQEKLITLENKLQTDIQAFFYFQKTIQKERTQLQDLSGKIAQKQGTSPLLLLDIEERYLNMQIKALNEQEDLIKDYLKYLQQSGKMCAATFVNYLQP